MTTEVHRRDHDYEITVDGVHAGLAAFEEREGALVYTHTEVDEGYAGKGVGSQLARGALDDARRQGLQVVPMCPFIRSWIDKHPDYQDLVREQYS